MKKRVIALFLALIMLLSLAACAKPEAPAADAPAADAADPAAPGDAAAPADDAAGEKQYEDVTLTVFMELGANLTSGISENAFTQWVYEETGVILDLVGFDTDKLATMVASGDLYDINVINNMSYVEPLVSTGAAMDLTDWIAQAPNVEANFSTLVNYSKESLGNGGLYILPMRARPEDSPLRLDMNGNFLRWDHYVEAGAPEIASLEDYLDLLETIQNNNPTNAAGQKTYALSQWSDWGAGSYETPIAKYLGLGYLDIYGSYTWTDLEYLDLYNDENLYWQYAKFMFEANQRGILDPEAYSQTWDDFSTKLNDGRVLSTVFAWALPTVNAQLAAEGKGGFVDIPFADTEEFPALINRLVPFGYPARMMVISSKCDDQKMEAIMRLINLLYSEEGSRNIMSGVGTWEYDANGQARFTDETYAALAEDPGYLTSCAANFYQGICGYDYDAYGPSGSVIALTASSEYIAATMTDYEKEYCEFYGVEAPMDVMIQRENQTSDNQAYKALITTDVPTDITRLKTKIEDYMTQELPMLILSADEAAYEAKLAEMRADLTEMGYETARDFYKGAFEDAVAKYNALVQ